MRRKTPAIILIAVLIILVGIGFASKKTQAPAPKPLGEVPVVTTETPAPTPASKDDLIVVDQPLANATITSPLTITGKARGNWYFEASFPIVLVDWDGKIIAQGHAEAQGDWMTTEYVPFTATITFTKPDTSVSTRGAIILQKDNPSGDPKYDNALEIPINY